MHQGVVPNYPASHGCIRLPEAFAKQLWTTTKMGVRVIVSHGEVTPVAIAHAKLFAPKPAPVPEPEDLAQLGAAPPSRHGSLRELDTRQLDLGDDRPTARPRPCRHLMPAHLQA